MSTFASYTTPAVAAPDPTKHVNYVLGMVLGQPEFTQEFAYHDGRMQWLARDLLGYGTVTGLPVAIGLDQGKPRVEVGPGVALSPLGQLIRVCTAQCAFLNDWLTLHKADVQAAMMSPLGSVKLYVVLYYRECLVEQVPIPGEPCRSETNTSAPSRIKDDFLLDIRLTPPDQVEEDGVRDFVHWLAGIDISDNPPVSTPLDEFLAEVRKTAQEAGSPLDFLNSSPPAFLHIATNDACAYLRAAFRVWAVELRPLWRPKGLGKVGCCADHKAADAPRAEDGVLLAELDVPLDANLNVGDPKLVVVSEEHRPYLLHLRFLQEWLTCANRPRVQLWGDVVGDPGANALRAIQSVPIVPTPGGLQDNFVLTFKNNSWQGAALPAVPPPVITLAGDVQGAPGSNEIKQLQGRTVTAPNPQAGQVLTFLNNAWQNENLPAAPPPPNLGGDVQGAPGANEVKKLQGKDVTAPNPQPGQVLTFLNNAWQNENLPAAPAPPNLGGDLSGPVPNARIEKIQTVPVTLTAPFTDGDVLTLQAGTLKLTPPSDPFIVAAGRFDRNGSSSGPHLFSFKLKATPVANHPRFFELTFPGSNEPTARFVVKGTCVSTANGPAVTFQVVLETEFANLGVPLANVVVRVQGTDGQAADGFMVEISRFPAPPA
jgi:hypothetical protein